MLDHETEQRWWDADTDTLVAMRDYLAGAVARATAARTAATTDEAAAYAAQRVVRVQLRLWDVTAALRGRPLAARRATGVRQ